MHKKKQQKLKTRLKKKMKRRSTWSRHVILRVAENEPLNGSVLDQLTMVSDEVLLVTLFSRIVCS
jgi:hypothetical protein